MKTIPRVCFAQLPTPVEQLPRLSTALGGPILLVKRDDQTGLALGGNKTRKLEFLLAEAQAHGARTLITAGAVQSNHCRQTAAVAAKFGYDCILVLSGDTPEMPTGNVIIDQLMGAEIRWVTRDERDRVIQETFQSAWEVGRRPYLIPYGGSNPVGAVGYVLAFKELLDQNIHPDWIIVASSSGGTQAGLVLGARLFGFKGNLLGISIDQPAGLLQAHVAGLARATADYLGEQLSFMPEEILVNDDYLGGGYGVVGRGEREAIALFARTEGLLLDPVYTGRAAAGTIDLIQRGFFRQNQSVLFWHTGGIPALFADRYLGLFT